MNPERELAFAAQAGLSRLRWLVVRSSQQALRGESFVHLGNNARCQTVLFQQVTEVEHCRLIMHLSDIPSVVSGQMG